MQIYISLFPHLIHRVPIGANHSGDPVATYVLALFGLFLGLRKPVLPFGPLFGPSSSQEVAPSNFILLFYELLEAGGIITRVDGSLIAQKAKAPIHHNRDQNLMEIKFVGFRLEGLDELAAPCNATGAVAVEKVELCLKWTVAGGASGAMFRAVTLCFCTHWENVVNHLENGQLVGGVADGNSM